MTSIGQSLREEREARNISLEEIASATKIGSRYLEALEADRLDLMPGGFFIKGIIRAYAKAIGLDPDETLGRYRDAGLLAPPERGRVFFPRPSAPPPAPPPTLPHAEPAPAAVPVSPVVEVPAAPVPAGSGPAEAEKAEPEPALRFQEASRPRLSLELRKTLFVWGRRGLAGLLVLGIALVLWSPWRHRPAPARTETAHVQGQPLTARKSETPPTSPATPPGPSALTQAAAAPAVTPPSGAPPEPKTEAAPAAEVVWKGLMIEIVFESETWIQVYTDGELQIDGLFPAGATARAQASQKLLIHTGNAGGFTFKLNGRPAKPLGRKGQVLTDIKITAENVKDFLEAPSAGPPKG